MRLVNVIGVEGESLAPTHHNRAMGLVKRGKAMLVTIQLIDKGGRLEKDGNVKPGREIWPDTDAAERRGNEK